MCTSAILCVFPRRRWLHQLVAFRSLLVHSHLLDGLHNQLAALTDVAGWSETSLVSDEGGVSSELPLDDLSEGVVDFAADLHGLTEGLSPSGDDKVLLESQLVPGMGAAVDDVEAGHRHSELVLGVAGEVGEVLRASKAWSGWKGFALALGIVRVIAL